MIVAAITLFHKPHQLIILEFKSSSLHDFTEAVSIAKTYSCKLAEVSVGINHKVDELLVGVVKQTRLKRKKVFEDQGNLHPHQHHRYCNRGAKILLDKIFYNKHSPFSQRSCENLCLL